MNKIVVFFGKVYFWFIVFSSLCLLGFLFLNEEKLFFGNIFSRIYDFFFLSVATISILSIRGYIYKKRYFSKYIWVFFYFWYSWLFRVSIFEFDYLFSINNYYLYFGILFLPWYYVLYKYTFCMNEIFEDELNYEFESFSSFNLRVTQRIFLYFPFCIYCKSKFDLNLVFHLVVRWCNFSLFHKALLFFFILNFYFYVVYNVIIVQIKIKIKKKEEILFSF